MDNLIFFTGTFNYNQQSTTENNSNAVIQSQEIVFFWKVLLWKCPNLLLSQT